VQEELYNQSFLFGSFGKVLLTPRPDVAWLKSDRGFYYLVLMVLAAVVLLVTAIGRSRLGRLLRALSDSPTALAIHGTNTRVTRLLVFCITAFIAGISGAMFSQLSGRIDADSFDPLTSLILVAVLAVAGRSLVWSAFLASLAYFVVPGYISNATLTEYLGVIFGLAAIIASVAPAVSWDLVGLRTRFYNPGRRRSRIISRQLLERPARA
jgi:ABC-type branched-subunit amino acid transport system permease subunit